MLKRKPDQFIEDGIPLPSAGVLEGHPTGYHLVGDPAEPTGDLDTDATGVLAPEPPSRGQDREVIIAFDQVICNREDGGSQVAIGVSDQRAVATIDLVALVPRGEQPARPVIARALV